MLRTTGLIHAKRVDRTALCRKAGKAINYPSATLLKMESESSCHNYKPLPVVFAKARGVEVTDPEGKKYFDFLSGYGAVNHGHIHPRLLKVAARQMKLCTLSARAFHNNQLGIYADFITKFFGYDKVLPMNTGAEGVETALKLSRKWGYKVKGIKEDRAIIVCCEENFHGRTFGAITMSNDPDSYAKYGPLLPGIQRVPYGDAAALEKVFKKHHKDICGFIVEPIQGEAGVIIPPPGYLKKARELCTKYNIMFIADEVQSGLGRSGKMLAIEHEGVRPDVVILAKALSGGFLPVAAVLADNQYMDVIEPGTHGSTFGGNPLACAIGVEALRILHEERLCEKSAARGKQLLEGLQALKKRVPFIKEVRGRGLFAAIEFDHDAAHGKAAYKYMYLLKDHGVLAKTTHGHTLRISPPLVITEAQVKVGLKRMNAAMDALIKWMDEEAKAAKAAVGKKPAVVKKVRAAAAAASKAKKSRK